MRSTLRRLYSFPSALNSGFIMMTPLNRRLDAHACVQYRRGVHGPRSEPLRRLRLGLRALARQGARDRRSLRDIPLAPFPSSTLMETRHSIRVPASPRQALAPPSAAKDTILRWIVRDLAGILLICDERMRGGGVGGAPGG